MLIASPLKQGVQGPGTDEMTVQKQLMPEVLFQTGVVQTKKEFLDEFTLDWMMW